MRYTISPPNGCGRTGNPLVTIVSSLYHARFGKFLIEFVDVPAFVSRYDRLDEKAYRGNGEA